MNLSQLVFRAIAEGHAIVRAGRPPRGGLRILMYHAIGSRALGDSTGLFSVSPARFRQQMDLLAAHATAVAVPAIPPARAETSLGVALTFDDGYRDNLRVAAPILIERGIPFTVCVSAGHVRSRTDGFLSPLELKELAALPGASIAAHGTTHRPLTRCDDAALAEELSSGRSYLEDLLGQSVRTVAYPYGAVDARVRAAAEEAGYEFGFCTRFDVNRRGRDPLLLCRCNIRSDDSARTFTRKLAGHWDWYRFRHLDPSRRAGAV